MSRFGSIRRSSITALMALVPVLFAPGCGSDKEPPKNLDAGVPDSGANGPVLGGKLGAAVAAAASAAQSASPKDPKKGDKQPPESGVFPPGEADSYHAKDAPPKLDLLAEGADPKAPLKQKLDAPEQKITVTIGLRLGQGVRLPNIDVTLSVKPDKKADKGEKPKDEQGTTAGPTSIKVAATVLSAQVAKGPQVPKDLEAAVGKLKGAVIRYGLTEAGGFLSPTLEVPKDATEGADLLEVVLRGVMEVIGSLTTPLPDKAVGKDAQWIVSDRVVNATGVEVIRYRVFQVQKSDATGVSLAVNVRYYAVDAMMKLGPAGQQSELPVDQFESKGVGQLLWKADTYLPNPSELTVNTSVRTHLMQQGRQVQGDVQIQLTGKLGTDSAAPATSGAPTAVPGKP